MIKKDIFGWLPFENEFHLRRLIKEHDVKTVVEVGSFFGKSAAMMAPLVDHLWAVDKFELPEDVDPYLPNGVTIPREFLNVFMDNMVMMDVQFKVTPLRGLSTDPRVLEQVPVVDLVYIDGDHTYHGCFNDLNAYFSKAKKVICGDDYFDMFPGVMRAVDEFFLPQDVCHHGHFWWVVL